MKTIVNANQFNIFELKEEDLLFINGGWDLAKKYVNPKFKFDFDRGLNTGGISYTYDDEKKRCHINVDVFIGTINISWKSNV